MNFILENSTLFDEEYELCVLSEDHIVTLYNWYIEEKHFEYYTCRPLKLYNSFDKYVLNISKAISEEKEKNYILVKKNSNIPLGKIKLFDLNPRNHSAEFGYYLPASNRARGLGKIMLAKFIQSSFNDDELKLNKLYATTSSNNVSSIKLLEKLGFKMDGRLREHYWINENKYDQLVYSILKNEWM